MYSPTLLLYSSFFVSHAQSTLSQKNLHAAPFENKNRLVVAVYEGNILEKWKDTTINIQPLFSRSSKDLYIDFIVHNIDLRRYGRIEGTQKELEEIAKTLHLEPDIQHVYFPNLPVQPPSDIPPTTDNFVSQQGYLDDFGISTAFQWSGGQGSNVQIANIEYGYDPFHEDLLATPTTYAVGWPSDTWLFHGNGVLGILMGSDNAYGVTGMAPQSTLLMSSPFIAEDDYNIAGAIDNTAQELQEGDVLLIEQQGYENFVFCPVEIEPAVFDAIQLAVHKGIHVIEPAGNGSIDLDSADWNGWFDRNIQDSGAIVVGAGASPYSLDEPRSWGNADSNYG